jgi:hypothetical protein
MQSKDNSMVAVQIRVCDLASAAPTSKKQEWTKLWPSPEQSRDKRYDTQHQKDEKQDFRDLRGACSNATESEHGGDQRNDKKYQRIVEHL